MKRDFRTCIQIKQYSGICIELQEDANCITYLKASNNNELLSVNYLLNSVYSSVVINYSYLFHKL